MPSAAVMIKRIIKKEFMGFMAVQGQKRKRVSIVDVAHRAGVSQATASRVFDPKWEGKIRLETRAAVEKAAKELGYHGTSALVRGLRGTRTGIIALVMGLTTGYLYQEVIMRFVRALRGKGWQVLIFEAEPARNVDAMISQVCSYQVDAIIITAPATTTTVIDSFCDTDIPVVVFNRMVTGSHCSAVYCDGRTAAATAADFLLAHGHRRIGVITGNANVSKEEGRIEGFCQRIESQGGEIAAVIQGDYFYDSGYTCAESLLRSHHLDAIFCAEDSIAMGAMDAARACFGLRIPEDLSIMGFDNISIGAFRSYELTTMCYPLDKMIASTIEIVEAMIADPSRRIERIYDMDLVQRKSVRL